MKREGLLDTGPLSSNIQHQVTSLCSRSVFEGPLAGEDHGGRRISLIAGFDHLIIP